MKNKDFKRYLIYNEKLEYVITYEMNKDKVIKNNKITVFYHKDVDYFIYKSLENFMKDIPKIYITENDLIYNLRHRDKDYKKMEILSKEKHTYKVNNMVKHYFDLDTSKDFKKGVIKCGVKPTKYIRKRLP